MRFIRFISESIKHPRQVGAVAASSRFLARKMAAEVDGSTSVVEFGSGTGSITLEILKRLPENGRLVCFEINPNFCKHLQAIGDSRLLVINDKAENCEQYVDKLECIVSGLPLNSFPRRQREKIIAISRRSKTYIQFQYVPFLTRRVKRHFHEVKIKFVPLNIPPAFVFVCKSPKR
jgi:phospholipid N-methyltransferase